MPDQDVENKEFFGQVSKDGRSFIDLDDKTNARLILKNMDAYRKIKVKKGAKKRQEQVPQTA